MQRAWRVIGIGLVGACVLGACGDDDEASSADTTSSSSSTTSEGVDTTTSSPDEDADAATVAGGRDDFTAGPISYRFVHVAPDFGDVDVYARTGQGVVEEYLLEEGVGFGDVLEDLAPPVDGGLVVVPAGATDLSHFTNDDVVADISTVNVDDEGVHHTLVLHPQDDGDDGVEVTDYWETPDASLVGTSSNALPPAVPGQGLVVIANDGGEDSSVYVARPGAGACLEPQPPTDPGTAVGGTVVQAFATSPGANELAFHSFGDQDFDCTAAPVLTTTVEVTEGGRTFLLLHDDGSGDLAAMTFALP